MPSDSRYEVEVTCEDPSGKRRILVLEAHELVGADDAAPLVMVSITDVTDVRIAESEVETQRTWFRTTLSSIGDAVIATDTDERVTFVNPVAARMTGWRDQSAIGEMLPAVFNIVNEDTRKLVESPVSKAIRLGSIVGLANHTILIAKDGSERPIDDSAAPIRDINGEVVGVVMVFHDITERRAAEQTIEVSEVRYRRLFESADDGILILNAKSLKITDVNPFLLNLLGRPGEFFIGKELWEIGVFRDRAASEQAMAGLENTGSIRFEHLPLLDVNGLRRPVEIVANLYDEGLVRVVQCNIRDISERAIFERERETLLANEQTARMEAESANRSKDLFLATLSHEVRTPLNAILGWATLLNQPSCTDEERAEGVEVIERNARAQKQLIDDVLDVARIVSGKLRLEPRECDLSGVIQASVDSLRQSAAAKSIEVRVELVEEASVAWCDPNRMQQVVNNLLSNSIKFTREGGSIVVSLDREGPQLRLRVIDNGQGISNLFIPLVFDRFRQADSTTRRKSGGLGLGLSIVKHIVDLHGGTVIAASPGEGEGTTMTVLLPVLAVRTMPQDTVGTGLPAAGITVVRLDGLLVLVVDDEPDARRLLAKVLGDAGATVRVAASPQEAMDSIASQRPDVLLSDIAMPGQDGYDLIRQVRANGIVARDLPAIAITAFAGPEDRRRALMAGFQMHISKPIEPTDLLVALASLAGMTGGLANN